jgi:hypothetical protein
MLNVVSLFIGLISLPLALLAFLPLLGWANWLLLPLPIVGLAIGAVSGGSAGRNLNLVVIAISALRLAISPVI